MTMHTPVPDACPASLADLADALGLGLVQRLVAAFGGREVKFPARPGLDHPLVRALGAEDAGALCRHLAGDTAYIPRARQATREDVLRLVAVGATRGEIATMLRLSQRHVRRLANAKAPRARLA